MLPKLWTWICLFISNVCASNPCQNSGLCARDNDWYTCACPAGLIDVKECLSEPCQNGGCCITGDNAYTCRCFPGFGGTKCEKVVKKDNHTIPAVIGIVFVVVVVSVIMTIVVGDSKGGVSDPQQSLMLCLPLELNEMLLMSSARQLTKTLKMTDSRRPDIETFVTLASVCQYFHSILTVRNWFAQTLKQYLTAVCGPYRLSLGPHLQVTLARQRWIVLGLTKLCTEFYLVYYKSDTIDVYQTQPPDGLLRIIHVNGLKNPRDIAACNVKKCLYVADTGRECVWKLETICKAYVWRKWFDVKEIVRSLSVTSEGQIVMMIIREPIDDGKLIGSYGVNVYSADGLQLSSSLTLPSDIVEPWHVIQTVNKSFIVCHGGWTDIGETDAELHAVSEVSDARVLKKSYGGSRGSGLGQLDRPQHITLDKDERVFVADSNNHRVLLLNKQLNFQRVLLTWSHHWWPRRLIYDRATRQLTVLLESDVKHSKFEIYSLCKKNCTSSMKLM